MKHQSNASSASNVDELKKKFQNQKKRKRNEIVASNFISS